MGTIDAFQRLVWSPQFKQNCFPHRSKMGVLKSFLYMASWGSYVFELCRINANQGLTAEIDWNYTSWSRRCRKILIGLVVRGAKTVVVRGKNRILTQNREKLEMTVPIS